MERRLADFIPCIGSRSSSRVTIFWASLVLAAAYRIVCFALSLVLISAPLLAILRYQICRPCPRPNAMASFHYLLLIYFFCPVPHSIMYTIVHHAGVRPDIFLHDFPEQRDRVVTLHPCINICSNAINISAAFFALPRSPPQKGVCFLTVVMFFS